MAIMPTPTATAAISPPPTTTTTTTTIEEEEEAGPSSFSLALENELADENDDIDDIEEGKIGTCQKLQLIRQGAVLRQTTVITQNKNATPMIVFNQTTYDSIINTAYVLKKVLKEKLIKKKEAVALNKTINNIITLASKKRK